MSELIRKIREAVQNPPVIKLAQVVKNDQKSWSSECLGEDDEQIFARWNSVDDGDSGLEFTVIPAVGSTVVVAKIQEVGDEWTVIQTTTAEKIMLGGNVYGGLIIFDKLKAELEKINAFMDLVKQACAVPVPEPGNGANSAFQAALLAAIQPALKPDYSDVQNKKVTHG